jgi:hypothetical protein
LSSTILRPENSIFTKTIILIYVNYPVLSGNPN